MSKFLAPAAAAAVAAGGAVEVFRLTFELVTALLWGAA